MLICCRTAKTVKLSATGSQNPLCDSTPWFVRILHTDPVLSVSTNSSKLLPIGKEKPMM